MRPRKACTHDPLVQLAECCNYRCGLIYHVWLKKKKKKEKKVFLSLFNVPPPHGEQVRCMKL